MNSRTSDMTPEERREQQKKEEALHASSLQVPRRHVLLFYQNLKQVLYVWLESEVFFFSYRPPWNAGMSVEELDANEKQAFLVWRRSLARLGYE